jgi:hypothetical protein
VSQPLLSCRRTGYVSRNARARGFFEKYQVRKADGTPTDEGAVYLVLRLDEGEYLDACRAGARAFAAAVAEENSRLSVDLDILLWTLERGEPRKTPGAAKALIGAFSHRDGF